MPELGYLNIVLHAHLPFVRYPDEDDRLEERWLFEAMTESYVPLLQAFHRLWQEGIDYRVTISLSPPLISMLADDLLQSRYQTYMQRLIRLAEREVERTEGDPRVQALAKEYLRRFNDVWSFYRANGGNLLRPFQELHRAGRIELITSAATHAYLPYVKTKEAVRAQIGTAVELFQKHFDAEPPGIWIPECAYTPNADPFLKEFGIRYFFVDSHGLTSTGRDTAFGTFRPVFTPTGIAAFARDEVLARHVWSRYEGYPGDCDYREYYRDIGHDLDSKDILPFLHTNGVRVNSGIKYHRITGPGDHKELYDFHRAAERAALHAHDFIRKCTQQVRCAMEYMGPKPIMTASYDAELFGHWWYEGPLFLENLLRSLSGKHVLKTTSPSEYLHSNTDLECIDLAFSSWGRHGYGDVWLNSSNDWIYPVLHACEERMITLATSHKEPSPPVKRVLNQAARELMLAESSDFAFMMDANTMVGYAVERTKQHVNRFLHLTDMVESGEVDTAYLTAVEETDNLFPSVEYTLYESLQPDAGPVASTRRNRPRVLMLSWEFPPMTVGGLSRHVYDLSRHLVQIGCEVHVVTTSIGSYPLYEVVEGVHVHRVQVLQPDGGAFVHFTLQLNLMMVDACRRLVEQHKLHFDVIHAHDWLVCDAAKALKRLYRLPMIATVHATEHGRNQGIRTEIQRHIHQLEFELTHEAECVIVCSTYMKREVEFLFSLDGNKVRVLPNGVDKLVLQAPDSDGTVAVPRGDAGPSVLFLGRLVREKGVQVLLDSAPAILAEFPNVQFTIVGKGPMLHELRHKAEVLGIARHVVFSGFVGDTERNQLLKSADVAVFPSLYEPFGIAALEAMAAGTPVVVSDVGGLADIVQHEASGLKCTPDDSASLATQVLRLLRDKAFRTQLATAAEQGLQRFDWMNIAGKTMEVYLNVLPRTLPDASLQRA